MEHVFVKIYIHAMFSTKDRVPVLEESWRSELFSIMGEYINQSGCRAITVGGYFEHVHLLFELGPEQTLDKLIRDVKNEILVLDPPSVGSVVPMGKRRCRIYRQCVESEAGSSIH